MAKYQSLIPASLGALVAYQKLVPVAHVVAGSANTVLAAPTRSDQAVDHRPATAAERVPVMPDDVEPDEPRPETHDRLRVGVTC